MSETLRDLVVSLSLQTDNFTRNIRSVNKQIAEAESKFKLAAAGVGGFEKTATGLSTQLSTLERRLSLQKDAVTQYERALTAANSKLQECFTRQTDLHTAPGGRPDGAAGAQGTGCRGGAAGARVFLHAGRERFGDYSRQGQSGRAQDRVPRFGGGGQKARRAEYDAAKERAERRRRGEHRQHQPQ